MRTGARETHVLLLAGTGEARRLASQIVDAKLPRLALTTSLAGATTEPRAYAGDLRRGGFGGVDGLSTFIREARVDLIIDATHPFAAKISANAMQAAAQSAIPMLRLERPPWTQPPHQPHQPWTQIAGLADAVEHLSDESIAFLATGTGSFSAACDLASGSAATFYLRVAEAIDNTRSRPGNLHVIVQHPERTRDEDAALFTELGVTHVVMKNAGGDGSRGKLDAAADLGLTVLMIPRPSPDGAAPQACQLTTVETADAAFAWLSAQLADTGRSRR
ncbi:MAG: precorrin-6A/cobalt-precorrin-6A reductase [Pseudomonadota bacterium]